MLKNKTEPSRICLDGDWSISEVADRFPLIAKYLSLLLDSQPSAEPQKQGAHVTSEIDFAAISALDACGCQLLVLFIRTLRQNGIVPVVTNLPETFRSRICLLGFDREFERSL